MVQISTKTPLNEEGSIDYDAWLAQQARHYAEPHYILIKQAAEFCKSHGSMVPASHARNCFMQGLGMAAVLAELNADYEALVAALLFELVNQKLIPLAEIEAQFGRSIMRIIKDAMTMKAVQTLRKEGPEDGSQIEQLRKMLLAMINDVRVVLVKLAERTIAIRAAKQLSPSRRKVLAYEIMHIYAPLANRLGIGQIKWELEDRAFHYLQPRAYEEITRSLHEKRLVRESYITDIIEQLSGCLKKAGVDADVSGRVKHIYSIWRKMQKKQLDFDQLFDIRALRILVKDVAACYGALACVNSLWTPIPSEFNDYISSPKVNGYRSIHTVVMGPKQKTIEVQIRTHAMHEESEMGVAAHWRYKEGAVRDASFENRINWLRNLLDWQREIGAGDENIEALRHKVVDERIYVFTPDGKVIDLPHGATPIDFAYHIHTEIGHRCRGAKVNGKIVTLTHTLHTTDRVEIITGKEIKPSRDWLSRQEKYIVSNRAREKIAYYFRQEHRAENILAGKDILAREAQKYRLKAQDYEWLAKACHLQTVEELYAAVGNNDLSMTHVMEHLAVHFGTATATVAKPTEIPIKKTIKTQQAGLVIQGVDKLLSRTAGCCRPVMGDPVIGYITQGRGVTVHRIDCSNISHLPPSHQDRLVEVKWGEDSAENYPVGLLVHALNQANILRDLTALFANEKMAVMSLQTVFSKDRNILQINLVLEVKDTAQLRHMQTLLKLVPGVLDVKRG